MHVTSLLSETKTNATSLLSATKTNIFLKDVDITKKILSDKDVDDINAPIINNCAQVKSTLLGKRCAS